MVGTKKKEIDQHYNTYNWPDDPASPAGLAYYKKAIAAMTKLLKDKCIKDLKEKNRPIRILEICAGCAYGGIALSKLLLDSGLTIELYATDIRPEPLRSAKKFADDILHQEIHTIEADIFELPAIDEPFDICLMYGLSTPHFNPWEMVVLLNKMSSLLQKNACMIVHEIDRRFTDFIENNYQNLSLVEGHDDNVLVSIHHGYDILKGTSKRQYYGLKKQIVPTSIDSYTWGVAESGAFMWTVFEEVKVVNVSKFRYLLVGKIPRVKVMNKDELKLPDFLDIKQ